MNPITLLQPPRIVFGNGCAPECAGYLSARGVKRLLVVTSTPVKPTLSSLLEALKGAGIEIIFAPMIDTEPTRAMFEAALPIARAHAVDGVLGVGGGSAID